MTFQESHHAHRWLDPLDRGIEIGAGAHNPFRIRGRIANVDITDRDDTKHKTLEREFCGRCEPVDVVASADALPYDDASLDFVLSSHVLEHLFDPIKTLKEWHRVVRPGGIIYTIVPHRDRTFDRDRPVTELCELIARHNGDISYYPGPVEYDRHYTVWRLPDALELCEHLGLTVVDTLDPDDKVGNGFTFVIRVSE